MAALLDATPLTGYDEYDIPEAVEHFRQQMRAIKILRRTGMHHEVVRAHDGFIRHLEGQYVDRFIPGSEQRRAVHEVHEMRDRPKRA